MASLTGTQADGGLGFMALAGALRTGGRHLGAHFFFSGQDMTTKFTPPPPPTGSPATHCHATSWLALLEKITYGEND